MDDRTAAATYRVRRWTGWAEGGCQGSPSYYRHGDDTHGHQAISPTELLGRDLGEGTIIVVTVTVVREEPIEGCRNPWHRKELGMCLDKYGAAPKNMPKHKGTIWQHDLALRIAAI